MSYAEVSVNSPVARQQTFSYAVPPGLSVSKGQAVWVPFGQHILQGIVISLTEQPGVDEVKEISGIIEPLPLLSTERISLAQWISSYYFSPLFDAIALMLPPGFERRVLTYLFATDKELDSASLHPDQGKILDIIRQSRIGLGELGKIFGKRKTQSIVLRLIQRGLVKRSYEMGKARIKPKKVSYLELLINPVQAFKEAASLKAGRAVKQAELLEYLANYARPVSVIRLTRILNFSPAAVKAIIEKGFARINELEVRREPVIHYLAQSPLPFVLTADQQSALHEIRSNLLKDTYAVFLLHGVTGSGKTEVYLQALAETVRHGKKGIVLVPEIALTPQTIERFATRFPRRVAVLHSRLSLGEQYDEWQRIRNGECDVVIGPRGALFAPQPDLGLIVIDEEHEWTYKQTDQSPRYDARIVALKLAELTGATVVLGSATPDVETYYRAERGDYHLLPLPGRVTPVDGSPLPGVEVVDMKQELMAGNRNIFSRSLYQGINEETKNRNQVLLFLNRRGGSTFVQCRRCGYVIRCKRCDVSLTFHPDQNQLVCHQCNYRTHVPIICPRCSSRRIKFVGIGTQKVEEETRRAFPSVRTLRWDSDATRERGAHEDLLHQFQAGKASVLIGTQMIAKGLDLPKVTLVGVINADVSLNLPDFRSGERTFQLLSQVAGRAGRGPAGGKVIIQTYSPEHYAIQAAARHDYTLFYKQELAYRKELNNPPFTHLVRMVYSHTNETRCLKEVEKMAKIINGKRDENGIAGLTIIGPAPAYINRVRGRYRWQLVLRGTSPALILPDIDIPQGWTIDVDPVGII